jgi:hypothetical protein
MDLNRTQKLNRNTSPRPLTAVAVVHIGKNNTFVFSVAYTVGKRNKQASYSCMY